MIPPESRPPQRQVRVFAQPSANAQLPGGASAAIIASSHTFGSLQRMVVLYEVRYENDAVIGHVSRAGFPFQTGNDVIAAARDSRFA